MKKKWESPTMTVVQLDAEDIICTSGCSKDENLGEWDIQDVKYDFS